MFTERGKTSHVSWARTCADPDLMLLHGYTDAVDCWAPIGSRLTDRWGLVAVDARGHGASGLPEEPFGPTALAADVAMVLDESLGGRAVAVLGHSMGGITGAVLAATRPDLVTALVLEDPLTGTEASERFENPEWLLELTALDHDGKLAKCRADNPQWPESEVLPWAISKEQYNLHIGDLPAADTIYLPDLIKQIRCPILMMLADTNGSIVDEDAEQECLDQAASEITVVRLSETEHSVHRDKPADYLAEVRAFLTASLS